MTLMERRRALIMAKGESKILFEWDYTDGISNINSVGSISPILENDGLLLQSGSTAYSACAVAPNIPTLQESYKAEITYKDLVVGAGKYSIVAFWHYNEDRKRVNLGMFRGNNNQVVGRIQNPDSSVISAFTLLLSGMITIEYNAQTSEITFSQEQNRQTVALTGSTSWTQQARIVNAQTGETAGLSHIKLLHIKIERL